MSERFIPPQAFTLDHLSQPVLYVKNERVVYRNRAAADLMQIEIEEVRHLIDPADLDYYRSNRTHEQLELIMTLGGERYGATMHHEDDYDVFIAQARPMDSAMSANTLSVVSFCFQRTIKEMLEITEPMFAELESREDRSLQRQTAKIRRLEHQLLRMAANVGDTGRYITGELKPILERTDLVDLLNGIVDQTRSLFSVSGITLDFQYPTSVLYAAVDRIKLRRAIYNLLDNALRFTPRGGRVLLRLEEGAHQAQISVSDDGKGISPEVFASLFDRYEHRDLVGGDRRWGLGMGMALTRYVANLHGGTVIVDSSEEGTTVVMSISRDLAPSARAEVEGPMNQMDYAAGCSIPHLELSSSLPSEVFDTVFL